MVSPWVPTAMGRRDWGLFALYKPQFSFVSQKRKPKRLGRSQIVVPKNKFDNTSPINGAKKWAISGVSGMIMG